ncbi:hypothetical protein F5Y17DRAFT_192598 [Xylariaceae sp. FL0594]|nr:hypothetical protein F5Y17DRAFT_192598 [Xylariaceae sp. FL0594]
MDSKDYRLLDDQDASSNDGVYQPRPLQGGMSRFFRSREYCTSHSSTHILAHSFLSAYSLFLHALCFLLAAALIWQSLRVPHSTDLGILNFDNRYHDWIPISYEIRDEYAAENQPSPFMGMPNEENTKAWDDLITPTYFSASHADMVKTGESINSSVALADGGYLAGLGVYHDIHCLRRLRLYLFSDYYYDKLTEKNMQYLHEHLGHCIESLRRTVMCNADTNIFTFTWQNAQEVRPGIYRPMPQSSQKRKCVNFEAIEDWIMQRRVSLNPRMVKPNGEIEKIMM